MMKRAAVTPSCAFCAGIGKPYTPHWQFSKPLDGVLTCPVLLAYTCRLCNDKGHIEKRCTKQRVQKTRELFCRFCCNAKKSDYQSHNQFDTNGFVQCPVLLAIECQLCGVKGHTKGYCPTVSAPQAVQKTAVKIDSKNPFSALVEEDLPVQKSQVNSWAGRLCTKAPVQAPAVQAPVQQAPAVQAPAQAPAPVHEETHEETHEEEETTPYVYVPNQSTSWADVE